MTDQQIIETLATKVMGWVPARLESQGVSHNCTPEQATYWAKVTTDENYGTVIDGKRYVYISRIDWSPLGNITHAYEVLEKLRSLGWRYILSDNTATGETICYLFDGCNTKSINARVMTPQEAICKAAMAWVAKHYGNLDK
ncbi:hypothetical protein DZB91_24335 [Brevibacillus sp. VP]|uniref:BC1872 family protein n=1 Tax=Brevibacillus sp. VP TaxID=2293326 RepID=UPI000E2E5790|nr:hypothetical protein [Brevibacillus sp. VP]RFB28232.1 hypothetical protein DZB91_24335 [Brevibacillus sp. VP]